MSVLGDESALTNLGVLQRIILFLSWLVFSATWWMFQRMMWFFTGVSQKMWSTRYATSDLDVCHVQDIVYRFKFDEFFGASMKNNFITVHRQFVPLDYLRKDNVTLYHINRKEAIFVESEEGVQPWRSQYGSFASVALFRYARRLITVPIEQFHRFAEELGDPTAAIVFLPNVGRCGSTLLCQAFESTERAVVYSEPYALNSVGFLSNSFEPEIFHLLARDVIRVYCKPVQSPNRVEAFVFKPQAPQTSCVTLFGRLFPNSKQIFVYRSPRQTSASLERLLFQLPSYMLARWTQHVAGRLTARLCQTKLGKHNGVFVQDIIDICEYSLLAGLLPYASVLSKYKHFYDEGCKVVNIRYEDLLTNPKVAMANVLQYCNLGSSMLPKALRAFEQDSQKNSTFARSTLRRRQPSEWTPAVDARANSMLERYGLGSLDEELILPGNIGNPLARS